MTDRPEPTAGSDGRRVRLTGGTIGAGVGIALLVIFMLQNTDQVTLTLFVWDFTWPVWLLVLLSAAVGAVVWSGFGRLRRRRRRREGES